VIIPNGVGFDRRGSLIFGRWNLLHRMMFTSNMVVILIDSPYWCWFRQARMSDAIARAAMPSGAPLFIIIYLSISLFLSIYLSLSLSLSLAL